MSSYWPRKSLGIWSIWVKKTNIYFKNPARKSVICYTQTRANTWHGATHQRLLITTTESQPQWHTYPLNITALSALQTAPQSHRYKAKRTPLPNRARQCDKCDRPTTRRSFPLSFTSLLCHHSAITSSAPCDTLSNTLLKDIQEWKTVAEV